MRNAGWLICALSWIGVTVVLLGMAVYFRDDTREFRATARISMGKMVDLVRSHEVDRRGSERFRAFEVYEFETAEGKVVQFQSPVLGVRDPYPVGTTVQVIYQPADPKHARIADGNSGKDVTVLIWIAPFGLVFSIPFFMIWRRSALQGDNAPTV